MKRKTRKSSLVTAPRFQGGSKHDTAAKLAVVKDVRRLILGGISKWTALEQIAKEVSPAVSATTVHNWFKKYQDVTVNLQRSSGNMTDTLGIAHTGRFTIQSVNVRLTDGAHARLIPADISEIATLASTIC